MPEWYQAPTFSFTDPYALLGAHDDIAVPPGCGNHVWNPGVVAALDPGGLIDGRSTS